MVIIMNKIELDPTQKVIIKSLLTGTRDQLRSLREAKKISRNLFSPKKIISLLGEPKEDLTWDPTEEEEEEAEIKKWGKTDPFNLEDFNQENWERSVRELPILFREVENELKDIFLQVKETLEGEKSMRSLAAYLWEGHEGFNVLKIKGFVEGKERALSILKDPRDLALFDRLIQILEPIVLFQYESVKSYGKDLYKTLEPKIETLYHATTDLRALLSKGFSSKGPEGLLGLGTEEPGVVSFTHSKHYARAIADSHKILAKISLGIITGKELLSLVKVRNLWRAFKKRLITQGYLRASGPSKKLEFREPDLPGNRLRSFSDVESVLNPKNVITLYMTYLDSLSWTRKGLNPMYDVEEARRNMGAFKRKSLSNIGIIACDVDILYPGVRYWPTEKEWKVPIPAIISCRKV